MSEQLSLTTRFRNFISDNELFGDNDKILLAVSGGMDSMAMTYMFHECAYAFSIAHCNFSMRGDESDADEETVRKLAAKFGAPFYSKRFDTLAYAAEKKLSVQQAARELRYEWFSELCKKEGYDKIVTAHHHNDSIETFFINLMRGSGPAGLRGIPLLNRNIVRPLLFTTREEIALFTKENKIEYRTDSSNETDDYLRNRIRHHLIPALGLLTPDYEERFFDAFQNISFLHDYSMQRMEEWKAEYCVTMDRMIHIPLDLLNAQHNPVRFLEFLFYTYRITGIECEKVLNAKSPGKIFIGGEYEVLRDRDFIILKKRSSAQQHIDVNDIPFMMTSGDRFIRINYCANFQNQSFSLGYDNRGNQHVDASRLNFPLTLRTWQSGDYFYPLGMKNRKKISDFFIDNKLSKFDKENTLLLLSGNDIVCILGHRIDDRYKVTETTEKILSIELS